MAVVQPRMCHSAPIGVLQFTNDQGEERLDCRDTGCYDGDVDFETMLVLDLGVYKVVGLGIMETLVLCS